MSNNNSAVLCMFNIVARQTAEPATTKKIIAKDFSNVAKLARQHTFISYVPVFNNLATARYKFCFLSVTPLPLSGKPFLHGVGGHFF